MGVDPAQARRRLGRGARAEGREAGEAAGGQPQRRARGDAVPGRHQHRQEGRAEGVGDSRRPGASSARMAARSRPPSSIFSRRRGAWSAWAMPCWSTVAWRLAAIRAWPCASSQSGTTASATGARALGQLEQAVAAPGGRGRHRRRATRTGRLPRSARYRAPPRSCPAGHGAPRSDGRVAASAAISRRVRAAPSRRVRPGTGRAAPTRVDRAGQACGVNSRLPHGFGEAQLGQARGPCSSARPRSPRRTGPAPSACRAAAPRPPCCSPPARPRQPASP